ncbi:MAG: dienelactone hydrolase family protein [Rickettsiales bacterium]|nr:dienelactone hydrolase family protein [Pseudomonadota bacterium]MDA0966123.1 dienelactone hydrolase family protein [Pseudomonadota bacterium]MDG4543212.1 dienelactone hydrolase family protein [Rickettsiales bacterium]MDG4545410.1 dienelactone hydrolase family protein [Rickettsiales bacterium]MDG4547859.1 dienelactone hydrolase family protein [Rickettsiales bacterium]
MTNLTGPQRPPESGKKAKQLVIFLHGLGADGNDLISLADFFAEALPDAHFVSPDAPYPCDMYPMGRQWFSLLERSEEAILKGVKLAEPVLNAFIDAKKKELGLEDKDIFLIGFSQGTMLSLHTAFRRPKPLGGILGYSGALVAPHLLKDELVSKPHVCLIHGEADEIVPFDAFGNAMSVLQKQGVMVHGYSQEGLGHGIDPAGIQLGIKFLKNEL